MRPQEIKESRPISRTAMLPAPCCGRLEPRSSSANKCSPGRQVSWRFVGLDNEIISMFARGY